jgi:AraC family transcriptional regulator of adaptative response / DNA-3-methyladenine glycosylase II
MIGFFAARSIAGIEYVTADRYSRVIEINGDIGSIDVTHASAQSSLKVTVRFPRLDALPAIISRVRRQFDLGADPNAIASVLKCDPTLAPLVAVRPGLRVPGGWDGFEIAVRAVLGQQISVKAATRLAGRLVAALGKPVAEQVGVPWLTHTFPTPAKFTPQALIVLAIPRSRAACLAGIAEATIADEHLFDPRRDLADAVARLRQLPGIGEWTAQYIAMRALGESDAFPAADLGLQRSLAQFGKRPTVDKLLTCAERWRPWRAYATLHLWMAEAGASHAIQTEETYNALTA